MKLNVCCGERILAGYTNVDIVATGPVPPDIMCDALTVPLPDACADEVMCIHGLEHFYLWDAKKLVLEWRRLLKPGGSLVLELPDLLKCCENIVRGRAGKHPDQVGMWGLYGDPRDEKPFMGHRWGWTPATLRELLLDAGFAEIQEQETVFHRAGRVHRDMRMVAVRA